VKKSLVVALIHVLIVLSLGGKLLYDRATRPRVWIKVASYDPSLPIRGRYLALSVPVRAAWLKDSKNPSAAFYRYNWVTLTGENHELVAARSDVDTGVTIQYWATSGDHVNLSEPVLFFLPEHARDPSWLKSHEELWAEVTLPRKGPPRPIQLAVKNAQGEWQPVELR